MILIQSVIIITSLFLVSLIEFGDADAQEQDIGALMDKGVALQNSSKNEEAIGYYDKALAIDPNQFEALYNKGSALLNLGRYVEAIEYTNKALAIDPNDVDTLSNKGLALNYLGKYNESIKHYDKASTIFFGIVIIIGGLSPLLAGLAFTTSCAITFLPGMKS